MDYDERIDANDPMFSSRMLMARSKKYFVHSGMIAIASPKGGISYIPFEISMEGLNAFKSDRVSGRYFFESVVKSFESHIFGGKYQ